jgi:uncharacterized repeat protein (TIGR01451 family)
MKFRFMTGMAILAMVCVVPGWAQTATEASALSSRLNQLAPKAGQAPDNVVQTIPFVPSVAGNYAFATTTTGSLTDMSSGTTQLLGANVDDTASALTNIGFDFYFQGVRYTQFSINENGVMRLGAGAQTGTPYKPLAQSGVPIITAYGADQRTHAGDGKIHYKVTGAAPSRVLTVEWLNNQANYNSGGTADLTYQVQLSETSGAIQLVYGSMSMSTLGAGDANSRDPNIGFSSSNTAGNVGSVTAPQSGTPAPTFDGASATAAANLYTAGAITTLDSATNGSRRTFSFAPPAATAPTGLSFSAITAASMTLNWVDSPDETAYAIYRSPDGTTYTYVGSAAQNATTFNDTALTPSTSYFYRVFAVSEGALSSALQGSQATGAPGSIASTAAGGNWSDPNTWVGNAVPGTFDNVTIADGATVTIDTAAVAFSVTVGNGGTPATLQWDSAAARTLAVGTFVTVVANGSFVTQGTGTVTTHVVSIGTDLINNGTLDFSTNGNTAGAGITFTGAGNAIFAGAGATTDVRAITINKGAIANVLELAPANFTVRGVPTDVAGFLTLTSGTFKISGSFAVTNRVFTTATYTIPASAGLWVNNPNFVVAPTASSTTTSISGLLRLTQGIYNVGLSGADGMGGGTGGQFVFDGGTLNTPRFDPQNAVSVNISAGTLNVGVLANTRSGYGTFELYSTTSTFIMSGGTINLVQAATGATPIDLNIRSGSSTVTGGVVNVGTAATSTNFNFRLRANVPNVVIDNTTNPKTATATAQVNLLGATTINSGTTFVINGFVCLVIGPSFTNNGTLTGTTTSTRFYFLGGSGPTNYNGSGTVTAPLVSWEVDNIAGVTIDPAVNQIIATRFNNFSGGLSGSSKLTLGNGGSTTAVVQLGVATPSAAVFGFDVPPVFNPGTGGVINIYAQELGPRTTGNELPPSRTLTTLSVSNTFGTTIAGGDLTVNGAGAGAIALTNAPVITGSNVLYFDSAAGTVTRSGNGYVVGNFRKSYAASSSKTFELGTANGYSPVVINATAGSFPTNITAKAVQSIAPGMSPPDKAITRYWNLDAPGVTATLTFNYLDPLDIPGTVTEANLLLYRRDGLTFTDLGATLNTGANTALVAGVSTFGDFTLAEAGAVVVEEADLAISKTDGITTVDTGGSLTYAIVASNNGPTAVVGASVADSLPTDLTCNWTCTGNAGGSCDASGSGDIAELVDLPVGASATFTVGCTVAAVSANTSISNTATITPPMGITDPTSGNDSATDVDALIRLSDLSIIKSDGVATVAAGGTTTYTIVVGNSGANDAAVTTTDMFPAALTGCTWTCAASNGTCTSSGSGDIADAGLIDAGGSLTYTATCGVSVAASGNLVNTASVTLEGMSTSDPDPSNNSATDTDAIVGVYDVGLTLTDNRENVKLGDTLNYIITVGNPVGPSTASSQVSDILPAELSGGTWVCVPFGGASCSGGFGNVLNDNAILPAGSQVAYVYSVTVTSISSNDLISNTASVSTAGDSNAGNDSATDTDNLVMFVDGFDGTPLNRSLEGFVGGTDFVQTELQVNPVLLAQLGISPVTVAWGYSASGAELFSLEIARFGSDTVVRTSLVDSTNSRQRSAWQGVDIANLPLELVWQSASTAKPDGYVVVAAGGVPVEMSGIAIRDLLTSMRVAIDHDTAWLRIAPR